MPTEKQIEARRANARLSRGPKTPEGKAISSRNAVTLGFFSKDPLLPGECDKEWNEFHAGLLDSLQPVGDSEQKLAERIILQAWRLRRIPLAEAGLYTMALCEDQQELAHGRARGGGLQL